MLEHPLQINKTRLPSRLVMAPIGLERAEEGQLNQSHLDYYHSRTKHGGVGLVIVEHHYVSLEGKAGARQAGADTDDKLPGLIRLAQTIHANGTPALLQLSHGGSAARTAISGREVIAPSSVRNPCSTSTLKGEPDPIRAMEQADIDRVIDCFVAAALRAKAAGFDGVEVHSAHGYLLDQFYSPLTNHRRDAYSGETIEGRTLLQRQILQRIRAAVGPDFLLAIRLGGCDYDPTGALEEDLDTAVPLLAQAGANLLDISGGMCCFSHPGHNEPGWFAHLSRRAKRAASVPVLLTGGIKTRAQAEELLGAGAANLIGMGRPFLRSERTAADILNTEQ